MSCCSGGASKEMSNPSKDAVTPKRWAASAFMMSTRLRRSFFRSFPRLPFELICLSGSKFISTLKDRAYSMFSPIWAPISRIMVLCK